MNLHFGFIYIKLICIKFHKNKTKALRKKRAQYNKGSTATCKAEAFSFFRENMRRYPGFKRNFSAGGNGRNALWKR